MKRLIPAVAIFLLLASTAVAHAAASGTISGPNEAGPYAINDTVTFTWSASGLKGTQYPMIYLECRSVVDGTVLYGQLDHPDTAFVLGGGSSPWRTTEHAGEDATCVAYLYAYDKRPGLHPAILLDQTAAFDAAG